MRVLPWLSLGLRNATPTEPKAAPNWSKMAGTASKGSLKQLWEAELKHRSNRKEASRADEDRRLSTSQYSSYSVCADMGRGGCLKRRCYAGSPRLLAKAGREQCREME